MKKKIALGLAALICASALTPVSAIDIGIDISVGDKPYYLHGPGYWERGVYYVWAPGHWKKRGKKRVWIHGHYKRR